MKLSDLSPAAGAAVAAGGYAVVAIVLIFLLSTSREAGALTAATGMVGAAMGWLFGVALSPYTEKEESSFNRYASALAAFASGYLIARTDDLVKSLFTKAFFFTAEVGFRVAIFLTALLVSMLAIHANRSYAHRQWLDSQSPPSTRQGQ